MKSFRLDPDSVTDFFDSWPALVVGAILAGLFVFLGLTHPWSRILALVIGGIYGGYLLRGLGSKRLEAKYPGARWVGLLTVGMTTATLGAVTRMAFPAIQGSGFDIAWLAISFTTILFFVIVNRKNPYVMQ